MYNPFNPFNPYGGQMPQNNGNFAQPQYQPPKQSNKIYVSGIEAARAYQVPFNSEILLVDSEKDILYEVVTDAQGKKTVNVFDITVHQEEPSLSERVGSLEAAVAKLIKGGQEDEPVKP